MDPFKARIYLDAPDGLEKGCSETQPSHLEACHTCSVTSAQLARPRGPRRFFVKHPLIILGTVALTWLVFLYGKRALSQPYHAWHWADDRVRFPPPPDERLVRCVDSTNWTTYYDQPSWTPDYPYGAETTFSLPLDSDALYLVSQGPFQHGLVNIEQSTEVVDKVDVRIRVAYHHDEALKHATVCHLERAERGYGVGIFTYWKAHHPPHYHRPNGELQFNVTLTLPAGNEGPLSVKVLETKMPDYSQNVAGLQESVLFDRISLTSANGKLSVQSITCEVGEFASLNGEIEGHFNVRSSLDLHTLNGRIAPTVNLSHREGADPSNFAIHTLNGQIDAEISLVSEALIGGEFEVDAETRYGEIGLNFSHIPVDAVLRCQAETTVGGIQVDLDSAFEGAYSLQTTLGKKVVSQHDVEDPAGKGRHRVVTHHEAAGRVEGELRWVESDGSSSGNEGYVILKAIIPSVTLAV